MITSITELIHRLQKQTLNSLQNRSAMSSPAAAYASGEKETSEYDAGINSNTSSAMGKELNKAIEKSMTKKQNRSQISEEEEDNIQTLIRIEMTLYENGGR
ncbi:unnamed protein product [Parnassius apollo]|uniref:(apollo) hypothetical protein n=1 Tax=Parnassius apollo TaxID=110799 RepID=A0A8S3YAZ2_PARAO|nr:unnamed protein product [Parnassius apollo]